MCFSADKYNNSLMILYQNFFLWINFPNLQSFLDSSIYIPDGSTYEFGTICASFYLRSSCFPLFKIKLINLFFHGFSVRISLSSSSFRFDLKLYLLRPTCLYWSESDYSHLWCYQVLELFLVWAAHLSHSLSVLHQDDIGDALKTN